MKSIALLQAGEKPIKNAPPVLLGNGEQCIPQHYLLFSHTRESVEQIVLDIEYHENYLIFVCEDHSGIYIQIGIIGFDNYEPFDQRQQQKVVYGRKWRVEPQLPTSEIIQTVFLALKSAREHEVRELFKLVSENRITTPFSNHHDLPLMAQNGELVMNDFEHVLDLTGLQHALSLISYDASKFILESLTPLNNKQYLLELKIESTNDSLLPEINGTDIRNTQIKNTNIGLLLDSLTTNELYYQLMDTLLVVSNRHVEENFHYFGFARFSRNNNIQAIARLSSALRKGDEQPEQNSFVKDFEKANYETDTTRVPALHKGRLAAKIKMKLAAFGGLQGILPG